MLVLLVSNTCSKIEDDSTLRGHVLLPPIVAHVLGSVLLMQCCVKVLAKMVSLVLVCLCFNMFLKADFSYCIVLPRCNNVTSMSCVERP
jgi:hypothetical protein